jgi:hypothetical protein
MIQRTIAPRFHEALFAAFGQSEPSVTPLRSQRRLGFVNNPYSRGIFMKKVLLALALMAVFHQSAEARPDQVSRDGYVFGGLVGSIAGFGIGHAVQGRYAQIGWAFTVGEGLGILSWLTVPWIIQISGNQSIAPEVISKIGMAIFGGFRLWQITDLWVHTKPDRPVLADSMRERAWQKGWWGEEKTSTARVASINLFSW